MGEGGKGGGGRGDNGSIGEGRVGQWVGEECRGRGWGDERMCAWNECVCEECRN